MLNLIGKLSEWWFGWRLRAEIAKHQRRLRNQLAAADERIAKQFPLPPRMSHTVPTLPVNSIENDSELTFPDFTTGPEPYPYPPSVEQLAGGSPESSPAPSSHPAAHDLSKTQLYCVCGYAVHQPESGGTVCTKCHRVNGTTTPFPIALRGVPMLDPPRGEAIKIPRDALIVESQGRSQVTSCCKGHCQ